MNDQTQTELEKYRPSVPAEKAIGYCLGQLYLDKAHGVTDECAKDLKYEEVIGALLLSLDKIAAITEEIAMYQYQLSKYEGEE